jgi:ketol-acid reductoisomerase
MLVFSSGYNVAFRYIEPPSFVDVGLIAPRILGPGAREHYESGEGFHGFIAIGQDATGNAWNLLLALAGAMGALRAGVVEVTFEREVELDLFMQQAVMPALHHVLTTAAELLLARGYPPEAAFTELYLSGELTYYLNHVAHTGLLNTLRKTPLTHQYGTVSRLDRFSDLKLERLMEVTLNEIHEGAFAREWSKEYEAGSRRLNSFYKNQEGREVWEFEQQTVEALGLTGDLDA